MTPIAPQRPPETPASLAGRAGHGEAELRRDPRQGGTPGSWQQARQHGSRDGLARGAGHPHHPGQGLPGTEPGGALAFGRRVQDVLDDQRGREQDRSGARDEGGPRLLAVAEAPPASPFTLLAAQNHAAPAEAAPLRPEAIPVAPALQERILDIAARVEGAFRAELSASAGGPTSLRIPLEGLVEGLRDITVTVTPAGLDIVMTRAATGNDMPQGDASQGDASQGNAFQGDPSQGDLVQAAQWLATHLQARFAKRSVRVLEVVEGAAAARPGEEGGDALRAIGRLLDRSAS